MSTPKCAFLSLLVYCRENDFADSVNLKTERRCAMQQDTNGIRLQQLGLKTRGEKESKSSMETVKEAILDVMRDRGARVGYSLSDKTLYHQVRPKLHCYSWRRKEYCLRLQSSLSRKPDSTNYTHRKKRGLDAMSPGSL